MLKLQELVEQLQEMYPTLEEYQAVKLAIEIIRNDILIEAFGVGNTNKAPAFLEGIAMALGMKEEAR